MRPLLLAGTTLALSLTLGCDAKRSSSSEPSPSPSPQAEGPSTPAAPRGEAAARPVEKAAAPSLPPLASIVYATHPAGAPRQVVAAVEDGSAEAVTLSASGVDTSFVAALPGRKVLLAEHGAGGAITRLVRVGADGSSREGLGAIEGSYDEASNAKVAGEAVVVEMTRAAGKVVDVVSLRPGEKPVVLAKTSHLVAASAKAVAVLGDDGNARSVSLDGAKSVQLGAGDGHDRVAQEAGGRLLLGLHGEGQGDVRAVGVDGSSPVDLGKPGVDEQPFAIAKGRAVFARGSSATLVLVSASLAGGDERVLTQPGEQPRALFAADDGSLVFGAGDGSLRLVSVEGGAERVLDKSAGTTVKVAKIEAGRVFYTGSGPHWSSLRAASLDGSGAAVLCEKTPWLPFFSGLTPDGRAVFYRGLSGQPEGGAVYSVKLDGSDLRPLGTQLLDLEGESAGLPVDHDFEAITPQGRVVLEAEVEGVAGSRLLIGDPTSAVARAVTPTAQLRFKALIP